MPEIEIFTNDKKQPTYYLPPDPAAGRDKKKRVPSVTTVLNLRSKPALDAWKAKNWKEGMDPKEVAALAALRGKIVHAFVESYVTGKQIEFPPMAVHPLTAMEVAEIEAYCAEFRTLWDGFVAAGGSLFQSEIVLTSSEYSYGGTIDLIVRLPNGKLAIWDIKTGKDCYPEQRSQVAAYVQLAIENYLDISWADCAIVILSKEDFDVPPRFYAIPEQELRQRFEGFVSLLSLYWTEKSCDDEPEIVGMDATAFLSHLTLTATA